MNAATTSPRLVLVLATFVFACLSLAPVASAATPELGAEADAGNAKPRTIPLAAGEPDWLTPQLRAEVLAADGAPVAAPNDAPLPSEVGIRPGAWMISPAGCTMNFVFERSGALGIGTAGHCAEVGDEVILLTLAPSGDPVLVNIGRVALSHDNGVGDDFALVEIDPRLYPDVSATTALIGGPCRSYFGSGPETVAHYGHGLAIGTGGTPRVGVALTWFGDSFGWDGAGIFGDSGSPVRVTDLKAAGNLTHLVVDPKFLPSYIAGTRIGKILEIAGSWTLRSSPLCPGADGGGTAGETSEPAPAKGGGGGRKTKS